MSRPVRYGSTDDEVLRSVLYDLYKNRCYWCSRVKDFTDIETDHIIPKSLSGNELDEALARVARPQDFDRDDPENLAPICGRCNGAGVKGDKDLTHLPVVVTYLEKARLRRPEVIRRVQAFGRRRRLSAAFVSLKNADLSNDESRRVFEENLPAVLRKVALSGNGPVRFGLYRTVQVQVGEEYLEVSVELEDSSRRAAEVLESVSEMDLEEVLQEPIRHLWQEVHDRVQGSFEVMDDDVLDPTTAGPPVSHYFSVDVDSASFARHGAMFEFTFTGRFEAHMSASLVRADPYGWERSSVELQGDAAVGGTFSTIATCDIDDGATYADESSIDTWEPDVWAF